MNEINFLNELFDKKNDYNEIIMNSKSWITEKFNHVIYVLTGEKLIQNHEYPLNGFRLNKIDKKMNFLEIEVELIFENGIINCIINSNFNQMNSYTIEFNKDSFNNFFQNLTYLGKREFDIILDDDFNFMNSTICKKVKLESNMSHIYIEFSFYISENSKENHITRYEKDKTAIQIKMPERSNDYYRDLLFFINAILNMNEKEDFFGDYPTKLDLINSKEQFQKLIKIFDTQYQKEFDKLQKNLEVFRMYDI